MAWMHREGPSRTVWSGESMAGRMEGPSRMVGSGESMVGHMARLWKVHTRSIRWEIVV